MKWKAGLPGESSIVLGLLRQRGAQKHKKLKLTEQDSVSTMQNPPSWLLRFLPTPLPPVPYPLQSQMEAELSPKEKAT